MLGFPWAPVHGGDGNKDLQPGLELLSCFSPADALLMCWFAFGVVVVRVGVETTLHNSYTAACLW